ncbi:unnamed protein product [Brassica oleracea]
MELLAGNCRKRPADDFAEDVDPFASSEWMYGSRSLRTQGNDDALATLADLAPPPQKLKPIRCVVKPPSEDRQHPLDILAGSLDRLPPEMGFLGDGGCFEAPLGSKIADVEESGQLTRGFSKDEVEMEVRGRVSRRDGVSLSSSADSDSDSSQGGRKGKRKRKTREKMEHFVEKLVGSMMKRQEKMHNQLIKVMEKMEHERIRSEEAWRQQEIERMKQNEEARMREMSRSSSIISFIKSVIGEEEDIEMPNLTIPLPKQCESAHQRQGDDVKFVFPSGRRWPHEEVQALIDSRSQVEEKTGFHRVAIWDDVSAKMKERGYERSAKKCKEKWENMNKYYKRVVEGKKTQPEHSKTRSYFEKLGKLYKTNSVVEKEDILFSLSSSSLLQMILYLEHCFFYMHATNLKVVTLKKDMERGGFHGYRKFSLNTTNPSEPAKFLMAEGSMQLAEPNQTNKTANGGEEECTVREQDRFMPIANVIRIMRRILPAHAKISDDSKETIQECVSEYNSFITGEANERCQREQRKTITAEDVLWAMSKLGFDDYIEPLTLYLHRYRELEGDRGVGYNAGSVGMTSGMVVKRPNGTMGEYGAYGVVPGMHMAPYHYRHQKGYAYSGNEPDSKMGGPSSAANGSRVELFPTQQHKY